MLTDIAKYMYGCGLKVGEMASDTQTSKAMICAVSMAFYSVYKQGNE